MPNIEVQCTHCQTANAIDAKSANQELKCGKCSKSFRLNPNPNKPLRQTVKTKLGKDGQSKDVLPIACLICQQRFGIKSSMSGSVVACPVCQAQLCFEVESIANNKDRDKTVSTAEIKSRKLKKSKQVTQPDSQEPAAGKRKEAETALPQPIKKTPIKKSVAEQSSVKKTSVGKPQAESERTKSTSSESSEPLKKPAKKNKASKSETAPSSDHLSQPKTEMTPAMQNVLKLLPPRYTVPGELAEKVEEEIRKEAPVGIELGIDTMQTRVKSGGELVSVKSVSREEKQRRKSLRVAILFMLGVIILIGVFWLLTEKFGTSP